MLPLPPPSHKQCCDGDTGIRYLFVGVKRTARHRDASNRQRVCRFAPHKLRNKDKTVTSKQRNHLRMNTTGSVLAKPKTLHAVFETLPVFRRRATSVALFVFSLNQFISRHLQMLVVH